MTATVLADEFIAVEVDSLQEPYVIGRALGHVQVYTGPRKREFMGWLEEGDKVIRIEAYRGLGPILTPTGREFLLLPWRRARRPACRRADRDSGVEACCSRGRGGPNVSAR